MKCKPAFGQHPAWKLPVSDALSSVPDPADLTQNMRSSAVQKRAGSSFLSLALG